MSVFEFSLPDFSYAFVSVVLEGMPFILAGTLLAGILDQFLPSGLMVRILPRRAAAGIALSAALGLVIPMCECGVVPVIRRLIRKGLPVSNAIAYMLAAPIVNPIVIISTYAAFKGQSALEMTLLRVGLAYLTACVAAMAAHTLRLEQILRPGVLEEGKSAEGSCCAQPAPAGWLPRLSAALRVSVSDFLDVMVFFVLGVGVSSLVSTALNQEVLLPLALDPWLATGSMMLLAFVLALCTTSDAFI
ncbi:MAG: permease, partial [Terrimicrobiaceae bacterium]|nr:permease [Terrimicrobiaceae bacterium]